MSPSEFAFFVIACIVPTLLGTMLVCALLPNVPIAFNTGLGTFLGWCGLAQFMPWVGGQQNRARFVTFVLVLFALSLVWIFVQRKQLRLDFVARKDEDNASSGYGWLAAVCAPIVATTIIPALFKPAFAWDSWDFWLKQAKYWFLTGDFTFNLSDKYPRTVSYLQTWSASARGAFDDALTSVPSSLIFLSFFPALFASMRMFGARQGTGLCALAFFIYTPMVANHLALSGYADLVLAVGVHYAGICLLLAMRSTERPVGQYAGYALFAACAVASVFVKRPAVFWVLFLVAFALWAFAIEQRNKAARYSVLGMLAAVFVAAVMYLDRRIGYEVLSGGALTITPQNVSLIFETLFLWSSYSLLPIFLLFVFMRPAAITARNTSNTVMRLAVLLWIAYGVLFVGTLVYKDYDFWSTVLGRASMHLFPLAVFCGAIWVEKRFFPNLPEPVNV